MAKSRYTRLCLFPKLFCKMGVAGERGGTHTIQENNPQTG